MIAVEIRDPREQELPNAGELWLVDPETGRQLRVDTRSAKLRRRFAEAAAAERARVAQVARVDRRAARRPLDLGRLAARARGLPPESCVSFIVAALAARAASRARCSSARTSGASGSDSAPRPRGRTRRSLPNLVDRAPGWRRHLPLALLLVALAAMIVGVARPHATRERAARGGDGRCSRSTSRARWARRTCRRRGSRPRRPPRTSSRGRCRRSSASASSRSRRARRSRCRRPPTASSLRTALDVAAHGRGHGDRRRGRPRREHPARRSAADGVVPPTSVLLISDGARDGGRRSPLAAARQAKRAARSRLHDPARHAGRRRPAQAAGRLHRDDPRAAERADAAADRARPRAASSSPRRTTSASATSTTQLRSRLGHKRQSREITDVFAGGAALLLLAGGALSALWFRRVP